MTSEPVLRLMPLGGLGEVGMNCMLVECGRDAVVIDCGLMFPEEDVGVDVVHPLLDQLVESRDRIRAVVLTHGHEDHIGSVPYLLRYLNVPIYGSDFTLRLVRDKLAEFDLPWVPACVSTTGGGPFDLGSITLETIGVNHSIPQANSVLLRTPQGSVLHTSDFKIGAPGDPDAFDRRAFERAGDQGVRLLLADSTNIEKPGRAGYEAGVADAVRRIVSDAPAGVFLSLFPSNVRRLGVLLDIARDCGRKVIFVGRSVERYSASGAAMGLVDLEDGTVVPQFESRRLQAREVMYIVAGTQGEARSAMTRIAKGEHSLVRVREGDGVVFSSRHIPGNEMRIGEVIDNLARCGARIHHIDNDPAVHVSGHAHREDLEEMLRLVRPRSFMPVHGNYHYLAQHAELARRAGVEDIIIAENGDVVELGASGLKKTGRFPAGKVHVDGGMSLSERVLGERRQLADSGIVTALVLVDESSGRRLDEPQIVYRGVFDATRFPDIAGSAREVLAVAIDAAKPQSGVPRGETIRKEGRKALKRFFGKQLSRQPAVSVIVVELGRGGRVAHSEET